MPQRKTKHLLILVALIACIAVFHFLGFYLELYWRISWYDRIVHTLGGIWVALVALLILAPHTQLSKKTLFVVSLGIALIVGIFWELFELQTGITSLGSHGYVFDTTGDIISDIVGGTLGTVYAFNRWNIFSWNQNQ